MTLLPRAVAESLIDGQLVADSPKYLVQALLSENLLVILAATKIGRKGL